MPDPYFPHTINPIYEKNIVWNIGAEYLLYMNGMNSKRSNVRYLLVPLTFVFLSGCVYYNTFFMAKKKFREAEESQRRNQEQRREQEFNQDKNTGGQTGGGQPQGAPRGGQPQDRRGGTTPPGGYVQQKVNPQERNLYEEAIKKAGKVLTHHPKSKWVDDALWLIGKAYFNMGEYAPADRKFKELVINHPESKFADDSYFYMALSQIELENEDMALETFDKIERDFPSSGYIDEVYFAKGRLAGRKGECAEAIEKFNLYLEKFPKKDSAAFAKYYVGQCYEEMGDYFSAYRAYSQVERFSPPRRLQFDARLASGSVMLKTDSVTVGMDILAELAGDERYFSQSALIRLKVAEGYYLQGEIEKSIEEYEAVTEQNPKSLESAEAYYRLGLIYQNDIFDMEKAKEAFAAAQSENPRSEYRNLALAKSAQIAKFETYRLQLERADSVRTARRDPVSESRENISPDSVLAETTPADVDSAVAEIETETGDLPPDSAASEGDIEIAIAPDSADTSISADSTDSSQTEDAVVEWFGPHLLEDSSDTIAQDDSSGIADTTSAVADVDSLLEIGGDSGKIREDEQAVLDSIQIALEEKIAREDSIRQAIIESGIETRFLLAELYAYELNQPDSALNEYLLIVDQYPDSPYAPKSLLAAVNIRLSRGDTASAEDYAERLIAEYPQSPHAAHAVQMMNYEIDLPGNALDLYVLAESLAFHGGRPDSAAVVFGYIADNFPDLAPKAAYARAWAVDLAADGADSSAYYAYESVNRLYPMTVYAESARERLGALSGSRDKRQRRFERKPDDERPNDPADSSGIIVGGLPPAPPVRILGEFVYPQSLLDRRLKGEVLFKIKINLFGKVEEHEIIGPSGEYAIDSSATAALLETEFDTADLDLAQLNSFFRYEIPFERPDINIFNDPYREERRDQ
jgi:TolA-binding protein